MDKKRIENFFATHNMECCIASTASFTRVAISINCGGNSISLVDLEKQLSKESSFSWKRIKLEVKNCLEVEMQNIPRELICDDVGNVKIINLINNLLCPNKSKVILNNYDYIRKARELNDFFNQEKMLKIFIMGFLLNQSINQKFNIIKFLVSQNISVQIKKYILNLISKKMRVV